MIETKRHYAIVRRGDMSVVHVTERVNDLPIAGAGNAIRWTTDLGPAPWDIYAYDEATGARGFVGSSDKAVFVDDYIAPDPARSPALAWWEKHFPQATFAAD